MCPDQNLKTAVFIMPRSSSAWKGSEALWITAAGWATAAKRILGDAVVVTSDRIAEPKEVWNYPLLQDKNNFSIKKRYRYIPAFVKILIKDLLIWKNLQDWKILKNFSPKEQVAFVWEKHDLFFGPGKKLSTKLQVPLITYVHAPVVWEASKWGMKRYFWGKWLEKLEAISLKKADLVAVVSEEVKVKVKAMGISENKILISPMAVDPHLFSFDKAAYINLREELNLNEKFVIGWTGSFRKFHGLDHIIRAFKKILKKYPETVLMFIGDGAERKEAQILAELLEVREKILFTGKLKFLDVPKYIFQFDVAVVSARSAEDFHYSPLKLREYMAAGKAVLAPNAGEIPMTFQNEKHLKLYEAGNVESLAEGMMFYLENKNKKQEIAANGKKMILNWGGWDQELQKALKFLNNSK